MYKFHFVFSALISALILQDALAQGTNVHAPNTLHDDWSKFFFLLSELKNLGNPDSLPKHDVQTPVVSWQPAEGSPGPSQFSPKHVIKHASRAFSRKRHPRATFESQTDHPPDTRAVDDTVVLLSDIQSIGSAPLLSGLTGDGYSVSTLQSNIQGSDLASSIPPSVQGNTPRNDIQGSNLAPFISSNVQGNTIRHDIKGDDFPVSSLQSDALSVKPAATGQQASPPDASLQSFTNLPIDSIAPYATYPSIQIPDALHVPQANGQSSIAQVGVNTPAFQALQPNTALSSPGSPRPVVYPIADPLSAQSAANPPAISASDSPVTASGNLPENTPSPPAAPTAPASPVPENAAPSSTSPEPPTMQSIVSPNPSPSNTMITPAPSSAVTTSISITASVTTSTVSMKTTTSTTRLVTPTVIPSMSNALSDQINFAELSLSLFILISSVFL
ncbi:uncharacterized protein RHIMIDRAFT_314054 [Rhizopus microsporus ATCC 52813]|uniref:Uncharacterized protein n=1 Tax=Rhizopus microsporus ATCC 52813 TaxID=1340429 RepID=A0A2G4ST02_RHIZD|nr:uncharacterized protein RHIMIDRAFT_314054 [Rhizopus microsporus ATCC 52813]PHZ11917.1 hypothetical protein RHIMIDRAFT_314054 [Rhizopus microsporus ATCC 52813]